MSVKLLQDHYCTPFFIASPRHFKRQLMSWSRQFKVACLLDNNRYPGYLYHSHECLLAVGEEQKLLFRTGEEEGDPFSRLKAFADQQKGWLFGILGYDLKNHTEQLSSGHFDGVGFPEMHFFRPRYVLELKGKELKIYCPEAKAKAIFKAICAESDHRPLPLPAPVRVQPRIPKQQYLETVEKIRGHILKGDLYEMNYCQEFFAENAHIDPMATFRRLNQVSQAPFSAYYRLDDRYLLCASPERFLKKEGRKLISQPIKGTIGRGANATEDLELKDHLFRSKKDRSENVMIVDLVRNDLGRSCETGSVEVNELYGIYGFNQVWQMISTVSGQLRPEVHPVDAIRMAFPMGSMTGAPKVRAMQLIEQYEQSRRGLYSGAVGYISPEGDFDFNVVIRSLLYNQSRSYLSFQVGGAIVFDSVPEKEYEECLLKAKGMLSVLEEGLHV